MPAPSATGSARTPDAVRTHWWQKVPQLLPGIVVSFIGAGLAWGIAQLVPGLSTLLVAILLGVIWCNLAPVPAALKPGTAFSARHILRAGIILLGLKLSLGAIAELGVGVIVVVVAAVGITFGVTVLVGHWLKIPTPLTLLVASGFSICGAAAVAGAEGVLKAKKEHVAAAIGLVVLFGTLMIPTIPFLVSLFGLDEEAGGLWAGASAHEVAQAVAAGGIIGSSALAVAVTVKLARVLMLAPVMAGMAWWMRRAATLETATHRSDAEGGRTKLPPIVPGFVLGFLAMVLLRTFGLVPEALLGPADVLQSLLLTAAMFALGLGVHLRTLAQVGPRPVLLGVISTAVILTIGGLGAVLVG